MPDCVAVDVPLPLLLGVAAAVKLLVTVWVRVLEGVCVKLPDSDIVCVVEILAAAEELPVTEAVEVEDGVAPVLSDGVSVPVRLLVREPDLVRVPESVPDGDAV